jgi:hypothetical protein
MSEIFNVCISIGGWLALLINNFQLGLALVCRCDMKVQRELRKWLSNGDDYGQKRLN